MIVGIASAVIALFSVLAAVWYGRKNQRLARENADLQKRLLEVEEGREQDRKKTASKAQLRARIEERGQHSHRLVVENIGNCEARNVVLRMDGKPFDDHPVAVKDDGPVGHIGANSHATRRLQITLARTPPFELDISWDDDSGEPGHYRTTLTF